MVVKGLVNIHRHGNLWGPGDLHQEWQTVIARQVNAVRRANEGGKLERADPRVGGQFWTFTLGREMDTP